MSAKDYFRPRGDITTVLDLTDRDSQDNTYFPLDAVKSWFHRGDISTCYPSTTSIQEFPQRGPADWGQTMSFELGSLRAGDLLQSVILQLKLDSWYNGSIITQLSNAAITTQNPLSQYWTYMNSLGTAVIDYADFIVNDQTIERITGEFIRTYFSVASDVNSLSGLSADALGSISHSLLNTTDVVNTAFHPHRPFPVEDGTYFCILPFFFTRSSLNESFPLLSCNEGNVRIDIKLRPFDNVVRNYSGYRANCTDTPLQKSVTFLNTTTNTTTTTTTLSQPPAFRDFRIVTTCAYLTGTLRDKFLRQPFEQMVKLVQPFSFEEPLKYLVSKPNLHSNTVEIQLPLELNHPVTELIWVFRRKGVIINNEWANFTPSLGFESSPTRIFPPWLSYATLRINGSEVISAEGDWFREHIAKKHKGGITSYQSHIYGFSFAEYPEQHQPSGSANTSRATSIMLNLKVNIPITTDITTLASPCIFDPAVIGGWEVFVYGIHYNWLRFENGVCNRIFSS